MERIKNLAIQGNIVKLQLCPQRTECWQDCQLTFEEYETARTFSPVKEITLWGGTRFQGGASGFLNVSIGETHMIVRTTGFCVLVKRDNALSVEQDVLNAYNMGSSDHAMWMAWVAGE